jgi:hypothetical protein
MRPADVQRTGLQPLLLGFQDFCFRQEVFLSLKEADFAYIAVMTRPQMETLIQSEILEYGFFDKNLCEADCDAQQSITAPFDSSTPAQSATMQLSPQELSLEQGLSVGALFTI